jgi:hypothetical protein
VNIHQPAPIRSFEDLNRGGLVIYNNGDQISGR